MSHPARAAEATSPRHSTMAVTHRLASAAPISGLIHDMIPQRAHLKWKARGCRSDTALQDWLEAEAEVRSEIRRERRS
jgi:hypothetical protein